MKLNHGSCKYWFFFSFIFFHWLEANPISCSYLCPLPLHVYTMVNFSPPSKLRKIGAFVTSLEISWVKSGGVKGILRALLWGDPELHKYGSNARTSGGWVLLRLEEWAHVRGFCLRIVQEPFLTQAVVVIFSCNYSSGWKVTINGQCDASSASAQRL